jgi:hypothetical protein
MREDSRLLKDKHGGGGPDKMYVGTRVIMLTRLMENHFLYVSSNFAQSRPGHSRLFVHPIRHGPGRKPGFCPSKLQHFQDHLLTLHTACLHL